MGSDWSDLYFKKHVMTGDLCTVMFIITVFYFVVSPVKRSYRYYKAISYFEGVRFFFLFFSYCGKFDGGACLSQLPHSFHHGKKKSLYSELEVVHVYSIQTPLPSSTSAARPLCAVKSALQRRA